MPHTVLCPRLVFSCPCCNLESLIQREFGDVYHFATPAAVVEPIDTERSVELMQLVTTARIREICIIGSPDCSFVKRALKSTFVPDVAHDAVIRKFRVPSDRGYTLSRKLIRNQAIALREALRTAASVASGAIQVRGILACGTTHRFLDVR
ncbi:MULTISPECIES: hypothetical protein [unclassified Flavobacterium]|uniref:hypothetical protein n=1 Tax=unclassified Flavobacterium TaxID=196869 RepID=UPI001F134BBA|nr:MULTISPECIES: hypothetical protein [unclassified Flavobacterium]UMY65650.1 hypothetical protein MKO97_14265 [Flavobacterium sp. HJ-32-4]